MQPFQLKSYKERDYDAVKQAYLVCQDYVVGAAFMGERGLVTAYTELIYGRVVYAEDSAYVIMAADDIRFGFWDHNLIWYECGTGISGGKSEQWKARLWHDNLATLAIIAERHTELRDLCHWHAEGRPSNSPYAEIVTSYYAEVDRILETETYLQDVGIKTAYIHSEIDTLERGDILRDLRAGVYDVLVGINLLREGLDLPEVSLVAIMDADKEGFLRSESALVQTIGRAARHVDGRVIMYGDTITGSMRRAIDETERRRGIQQAYNTAHHITPRGVRKAIDDGLRAIIPQKETAKPKLDLAKIPKDEYEGLIRDLTSQMNLASANLEFEKAAELRDTIAEIRAKQ